MRRQYTLVPLSLSIEMSAWLDDARKPDGSWDFEWIARNGHLHYHVWTQHEMTEILDHVGCRVLVALEELPERPDSFLCVARVEKGGGDPKS